MEANRKMTQDASQPKKDPWILAGEVAPIGLVAFVIVTGTFKIAASIAKINHWTSPASIVVAQNKMTIDGKTIDVTTSEFTPKGRFTVGKAFYDPTVGGISYPFKTDNWRNMDDRNPLKRKIAKMEASTGKPMSVAYAIHSGRTSNGCVTMPSTQLDQIKQALEGRTIEIK
jgi:hypothetical protein